MKINGLNTRFWPVIDDALRRAAVERGVAVRVLASHWPSTRKDMPHWLRSLADISVSGVNIQTVSCNILLASHWPSTRKDMPHWLRSLADISVGGVSVQAVSCYEI